jgi:hypothetical protein
MIIHTPRLGANLVKVPVIVDVGYQISDRALVQLGQPIQSGQGGTASNLFSSG